MYLTPSLKCHVASGKVLAMRSLCPKCPASEQTMFCASFRQFLLPAARKQQAPHLISLQPRQSLRRPRYYLQPSQVTHRTAMAPALSSTLWTQGSILLQRMPRWHRSRQYHLTINQPSLMSKRSQHHHLTMKWISTMHKRPMQPLSQ